MLEVRNAKLCNFTLTSYCEMSARGVFVVGSLDVFVLEINVLERNA